MANHCISCSDLGFDPGQDRNFFNKRFLSGTKKDGGAESQSLISAPTILGLNPKSLRSAYHVKAYVLLIATRP